MRPPGTGTSPAYPPLPSLRCWLLHGCQRPPRAGAAPTVPGKGDGAVPSSPALTQGQRGAGLGGSPGGGSSVCSQPEALKCNPPPQAHLARVWPRPIWRPLWQGGSQGEGGSWGWGLAAPPMALGWGPCGGVTWSLLGHHAQGWVQAFPRAGRCLGPPVCQHVWSQFAAWSSVHPHARLSHACTPLCTAAAARRAAGCLLGVHAHSTDVGVSTACTPRTPARPHAFQVPPAPQLPGGTSPCPLLALSSPASAHPRRALRLIKLRVRPALVRAARSVHGNE